MEITEAQRLKHYAERRIVDVINEFESKTKLKVTCIDFKKTDESIAYSGETLSVGLDINLRVEL
jgi:hypothetical protein